MQYVQKYMELYPEDTTVVKGGAAAYLILQECLDQNIPINDIDVAINTDVSGQVILDRWLLIVPSSYTVQYDQYNLYNPEFPISIFTLTDTTGSDFSLDIFVNDDDFTYTEKIGSFNVERLDLMIKRLYSELYDRKSDIEFLRDDPDAMPNIDLQQFIEKYNRMYDRLILLGECFKKRQNNIPF